MDPTVEAIEIRVDGHCQPGGSKTWMPLKSGGRYRHAADGRPLGNLVDANPKAAGWRKKVQKAALAQYDGPLLTGPMIVSLEMYLHRWKSHYGTGANARLLKDTAPLFPSGDHPDPDKLARPILDGLTMAVYDDDARVVDLIVKRRYAPGYVLKGEIGEFVLIRVMQHTYSTVGERAAAAQGSLLPA